jgi:hypothetical protein
MTAKSITRTAEKNPNNPYIQVCDVPKVAALQQQFPELFQDYKAQVKGQYCRLLGDFAPVRRGCVDLGLQPRADAGGRHGIGAFVLQLVGVSDVPGEVRRDDAPAKVLPRRRYGC